MTLAVGTVGTAFAAFSLWSSLAPPISVAITIGASVATAVGLIGQRERRVATLASGGARAREVTMAIVPWGVIIAPDGDARVLRWPAVRKVEVDVQHTMRGGTPAITSSVVAVHTEHEVFAGRSPGAVNLERLVANLDAYAREAGRPPARDLDGREAALDDATEPAAGALIRLAEALCASGRGASRLSLPAAGYRSVSSMRATPETIIELHAALDADLEGSPADPRPLASIAAGILGATELVPDLLRLVSSPHPLVAAFAKAAALRLGAPMSRAGSLDELGAFLAEDDLESIAAWAGRLGPSPP